MKHFKGDDKKNLYNAVYLHAGRIFHLVLTLVKKNICMEDLSHTKN